MNSVLCFTLRFLDPEPRFHGRGDDGELEWPPSPLRFFQALVSAAATRWRGDIFRDQARPALQWLEATRPTIVTPQAFGKSFGYRMYVPNNSGDLMTAAWARGDTDTSMAKFRVEKDVRPTRMNGEAVHFLMPLSKGSDCPHFEVLRSAARSITHLGWGIDMVAGDASILIEEEAVKVPGHRWHPVAAGGTPLRVPVPGTLDALMKKHEAFLSRLSLDGFKPVPPLAAFKVVGYHCSTLTTDKPAASRPYAAFALLQPNAEGNRSFNTQTRTKDVAGMMRSLVGESGGRLGLNSEEIRTRVHGHDTDKTPLKGPSAEARLSYLPLPTINSGLNNRVESIRRVLVVGPSGQERLLADIQRRLSGEQLLHNNQALAMLTVLPRSDWVLKQYVGSTEQWSSVTPVILPGYDDRDDEKTEKLLRKAFDHAGLPQPVEIDWRFVGFRAGVDLVSRYIRPEHMTGPGYHVRVRFPQPLRGPLAVGAGRYRGFGLFAAES